MFPSHAALSQRGWHMICSVPTMMEVSGLCSGKVVLPHRKRMTSQIEIRRGNSSCYAFVSTPRQL